MLSKTVSRKIASFEKRFNLPHLYLAYHAAFPLALTPDLLYRLWANFPCDINGQFLNIPWIAVSDILLSGLCEEVGQELYEMDGAVRNYLLEQLQADPNFGQQRIQELADFLLDYVRQQLQSNNPDIRDFAQAQRWTVLAYTKPNKVAQELAQTFQQLGLDTKNSSQQNKSELVRMALLIETFAEPLVKAELTPLLVYAQGIDNWARGNIQQAKQLLEQITEAGKIEIAGENLPIPEAVQNSFTQSSSPGIKDLTQDYSGQNLRGRSFRGKDLTGANFSNSDIRSTDFTNAILVDANFSQAKAGLQRRWSVILIFFSLILLLISGVIAILIGFMIWAGFYSVLDTVPFANGKVIHIFAGSIGVISFLIQFPILSLIIFQKKQQLFGGDIALSVVGSFPIALIGILFAYIFKLDDQYIFPYIFPIVFSAIVLGVGLKFIGKLFGGISDNTRTLAWELVGITAAIAASAYISISAIAIVSLVLNFTIVILGIVLFSNRLKRLSKTIRPIAIFV